MNEKILRQVEEMKKQTIGVEVEMNNITRSAAAKLAASFFGTNNFRNTASRNGYCTWNGSSKRMSAFMATMMKNANWSPRSSPTQTWNFCRN